jgi:DNA-binding response OmpR family regulator
MRILLVEDEDNIARGLSFNFQLQDYTTDVAETGEKALELFDRVHYDLIVLDVMLPGMDGFEVAKRIRAKNNRIPIFMLTAMASDEDRIAGLECGVDDYLTKPFVLKELLLRIAGLLRRSNWQAPSKTPEAPLHFGQAFVDPDRLTATTGGHTHKLTRIEIELMRFFASNPNRLVTRQELLSAVWGYEPYTATRTVDTFIFRIRKIIEPKPSKPVFLTSVRGEGYRYEPDSASSAVTQEKPRG